MSLSAPVAQWIRASASGAEGRRFKSSQARYNIASGLLAQLVEQLTLNQRVAGSNPARLTIKQWLIMDATDAILTNDDSKKNFLLLAGNVRKLFKAILPDPAANKYYAEYSLFNVIADKIIAESGDVDISLAI